MNREDRRTRQMRRFKQGEYNLSDPRVARQFLQTVRVGTKHNNRAVFPVQMVDGRILTADTASDADIMEIVQILAGPQPTQGA